jgi:hypothetical protein
VDQAATAPSDRDLDVIGLHAEAANGSAHRSPRASKLKDQAELLAQGDFDFPKSSFDYRYK